MSKKLVFISLLLLLVLQVGFIQCYLPLGEWFTRSPIFTDDYALHYGDVVDKKFLLSHYGATWGYNPYQRAGTVCNAIVGVDNNAWGLFAFLLSFIPTEVAFKLYFLLLLLLIPLLVYFSARNFQLDRGRSLMVSCLGTFFLHITVCVDFLYWGTVSFIFSCYLSLFIASLFYRFLNEGKWYILGVVTILFATGLWIHFFTSVNCFPLFAAAYLLKFTQLRLRSHLMIVLSVFIAIVINALWLFPFLRLLDLSQINFFWTPYTTSNHFEWVKTYFFQSSLFNTYYNIPFQKSEYVDIFLMLLGIFGLYSWWRQGEKTRCLVFALSIGFLFILGYYGSFLAFTRSITPMRFIIMMNLCLILPSAQSLDIIYHSLTKKQSNRVKAVIILLALSLLSTFLVKPYYHLFVKKEFRLLTHFPQAIDDLIGWMRSNTTSEGRILIENSDFETGHQYYGAHFPYIFPHVTGREFIGNDFGYNPTRDSFVSFFSSLLFHKSIDSYTLPELTSYIDLYNIGWIICWSDKAKIFFDRYPHYFLFEKRIDKFIIYQIDRNLSFFLKGNGKIKAKFNEIELQDVEPEEGEVIISYHWMKYLKAKPALKVERALFLKDPVGFIRLSNPPKKVLIYNNYR